MDHFAGLDVSVKETSVCIVDDTGKIVREVKVASEPQALLAVLTNPAYHFKRIGLDNRIPCQSTGNEVSSSSAVTISNIL
jgi:hypothetical protein